MALISILSTVILISGALLGLAVVTILGKSGISNLRRYYRGHLMKLWPYFVGLVILLGVNSALRELVPEISWIIGWNVTNLIYSIEGEFVASLQSISRPVLTNYFSFMYVYGYIFLLIFPFITYLSLENERPCRELIIAYAVNYSVGLVFFAVIVSYGPRNLLPDLVDSLLYITYPQTQLLTSAVNTHTNVFPSLHASLSTTVMIFAYRTRREYPSWFLVTIVLAISIGVATMYLGIHWAIDVVGGVGLALFAVWVAVKHSETQPNNVESPVELSGNE